MVAIFFVYHKLSAGTGTSSVWYHFKLNYQSNSLYNDFDIMQYKEAE